MKLIDIHSHLQFSDFDDSRDQIIQAMKDHGQGTIVVGTNLESSVQAIELAIKHENIWATIGIHPTNTNHDTKELRNLLRNYKNSGKIVSIGECGLDYYRTPKSDVFKSQLEVFQAQIELAIETQLPLMLHGRPSKGSMDAYQDMIDILRQYRDDLPIKPGDAHFFVGDLSIARQLLEMNFTLSFDGPITFARDYDEVIQYVPSDMIHAETDAPYAAPIPYRGQSNSPLYVEYVIDALINIRGESDPAAFKDQLVKNAREVFGIL
jgi:TatD DNase family protein